MESSTEKVEVKIDVQGAYKLPYNKIRFCLNGDDSRTILINGKEATVTNGSYEVNI